MPDTPRIYVACLASYNSSTHHGEWIDATDVDEMREDIASILRTSPHPNVLVDCPNLWAAAPNPHRHTDNPASDACPICHGKVKVPSAEEWAVHDYEGFGDLASELGEYPDLEDVAMHAGMIEEHGQAWIAYVGHHGKDYAAPKDFEESYCGEYNNPEDYAEELTEECYDIPAHLAGYIDFEKVARDLSYEGYAFVKNPETYRYFVFSPT